MSPYVVLFWRKLHILRIEKWWIAFLQMFTSKSDILETVSCSFMMCDCRKFSFPQIVIKSSPIFNQDVRFEASSLYFQSLKLYLTTNCQWIEVRRASGWQTGKQIFFGLIQEVWSAALLCVCVRLCAFVLIRLE